MTLTRSGRALSAGEKVSVTVGGQDGVDTAVAGRTGRLSRVVLMVAGREPETNWWFSFGFESEEESEEEEETDSEWSEEQVCLRERKSVLVP